MHVFVWALCLPCVCTQVCKGPRGQRRVGHSSCELLGRHWEPNSGSLQEQRGLLHVEHPAPESDFPCAFCPLPPSHSLSSWVCLVLYPGGLLGSALPQGPQKTQLHPLSSPPHPLPLPPTPASPCGWGSGQLPFTFLLISGLHALMRLTSGV